MFEHLRSVVEELSDAIATAGVTCALSPAHVSSAGKTVCFLDAPTLTPASARLSGEGGLSIKCHVVAGGTDREQVLALYDALPRILEAVPDSWALSDPIVPASYGDAPAFSIPLYR